LQLETTRRRASRYVLFSAKFILGMRIDCYLRSSGQNSDITIRFDNSDFVKESICVSTILVNKDDQYGDQTTLSGVFPL